MITEECTGCGACYAKCPQKAISFSIADSGGRVACIDESLCINCNLCTSICPQNGSRAIVVNTPRECWLCESKNPQVIEKSTSGGVFYELSKIVISKNGVVFGVKMNENFEVFHDAACDLNKIEEFLKSKYVQSDTKETFKKVKELLDKNFWVLFSGTPCQIAGLKAFLGKNYNRLVTVDFLCHGVPSNALFKEHISWEETIYNGNISNVSFREKDTDLSPQYRFRFDVNGTNKNFSYATDPYIRAFIDSNSLIPSCYNCKYASINRVSSITIADSWSGSILKSLVLINDELGKAIFQEASENFSMETVSLETTLENKQNLSKPSVYKDRCLYDELRNYKNYNTYANRFIQTKSYKLHMIFEKLPYWIQKKIREFR